MILLLDIDSRIPNLALAKTEKFYKDMGEEVIWDMPLLVSQAEKIYVSCVFTKNRDQCLEWEGVAEIGGSGYDVKKKLPPEIEKVKPKINLGFTTRGCIRKCGFCIVPDKEGGIKVEGDIYDVWDGKAKGITLLDNNILALPRHFKMICSQLRKENLRVDFNQGLDHRLLTDENTKDLLSLKHIREIRLAFDDIAYEPTVLVALNLLKQNGIRDWGSRWYVYIGENDTFHTVFHRMELLRKHKQAVYVMRDEKVYNQPEYIALSSWGNTMGAFKMPLAEVLNISDRMKPYKKYFMKYLSKTVGG